MGLRQILVNAVAVADRVTRELQCAFTLETFVSRTAEGVFVGTGVLQPYTGVIEWKLQLVRTHLGQEVLAVAKITVPRDIVITIEDRLIITAGDLAPISGPFTAPILAVNGVLNPVTKRPYATDIYLGASVGQQQ